MHLGAKFCFASIAFSEYLVEKFQGEFTNTQSNRSTDPHRNQTLLLFLSLKGGNYLVSIQDMIGNANLPHRDAAV